MGRLAVWTKDDEELFRANLSPEARLKLVQPYRGPERRSEYRQSTRALVAKALEQVPRWPVVRS
jgi:hypothetical protein